MLTSTHAIDWSRAVEDNRDWIGRVAAARIGASDSVDDVIQEVSLAVMSGKKHAALLRAGCIPYNRYILQTSVLNTDVHLYGSSDGVWGSFLALSKARQPCRTRSSKDVPFANVGWPSSQSELGPWRSSMLFLKTRKSKSEAQKFLAQVANQWTMDRVRTLEERRGERRATLNVGVWVIPLNEAAPEISQAFVALTRDLSSNGLSVVTNRPIDTPEFLVCFAGEPEAKFLRANVLCLKHLGLGWSQLCMEVIGMVEKEKYPQLTEFTGSVMF